ASVEIFNHRPADQGIDDLRNNDKEIEYPHIDSHFPCRNGSGQNGIWHGQYAGPGNSYGKHGDYQPIQVGRKIYGNKTQSAYNKRYNMSGLSSELRGYYRQKKCKNRRNCIVDTEQHTYPVPRILIGPALRVLQGKSVNMMCDGRSRKYPHTEQA